MKPDYEKAFHDVLELEGVFSNHKADPGGKTKYGVTENEFWRFKHERPDLCFSERVENLTVPEAKAYYKWAWWDGYGLSRLDKHCIAEELFEAAINCSPTKGVKFLQDAYNTIRFEGWPNLDEDGKLGPKTIQSINDICAKGYTIHLLIAMNCEQYQHYEGLADKAESFHQFTRGWMRRISDELKEVA